MLISECIIRDADEPSDEEVHKAKSGRLSKLRKQKVKSRSTNATKSRRMLRASLSCRRFNLNMVLSEHTAGAL